jgi:hypothetical protein
MYPYSGRGQLSNQRDNLQPSITLGKSVSLLHLPSPATKKA